MAALYAALTVDVMLEKLGAGGPIVVEGSFHRNEGFCGLLAALRPAQQIHAMDDPAVPRGAWLLARWADAPPAAVAPRPATTPWVAAGLEPYLERRHEESLRAKI